MFDYVLTERSQKPKHLGFILFVVACNFGHLFTLVVFPCLGQGHCNPCLCVYLFAKMPQSKTTRLLLVIKKMLSARSDHQKDQFNQHPSPPPSIHFSTKIHQNMAAYNQLGKWMKCLRLIPIVIVQFLKIFNTIHVLIHHLSHSNN